MPCPYWWPRSAGRPATPIAKNVSSAATRSVPEWSASEIEAEAAAGEAGAQLERHESRCRADRDERGAALRRHAAKARSVPAAAPEATEREPENREHEPPDQVAGDQQDDADDDEDRSDTHAPDYLTRYRTPNSRLYGALTAPGYRDHQMRRALLLVSVLLSLAFAGEAAAEEVVVADDQGRSIRFDVAPRASTSEWYAALLRAAPHADEISTVRIDLVTPSELAETCGSEAAGCYGRRMITVAAARDRGERAHARARVRASRRRVPGVADAREPNGSSTWWRARGMARLVELRSAYHGYVRGWDAQHRRDLRRGLRAARAAGRPAPDRLAGEPNDAVLAAILHDLGLGPEPAITRPPQLKPVSETRRGRLAPGRTIAFDPFTLLGSGRRVRATVEMPGSSARESAHGSSSTATGRGSPPARSDEA